VKFLDGAEESVQDKSILVIGENGDQGPNARMPSIFQLAGTSRLRVYLSTPTVLNHCSPIEPLDVDEWITVEVVVTESAMKVYLDYIEGCTVDLAGSPAGLAGVPVYLGSQYHQAANKVEVKNVIYKEYF